MAATVGADQSPGHAASWMSDYLRPKPKCELGSVLRASTVVAPHDRVIVKRWQFADASARWSARNASLRGSRSHHPSGARAR
jgi:hypothetical protein